jgi:hypothetical protein
MTASRTFVLRLGVLALALAGSACHRDDARDANAPPQGMTEQDMSPPRPATLPPKPDEKTGTDSTGRPSDASGGRTGADPARDQSKNK